MTDLELLFLVLVIIYIWECAWWIKNGSVGFRSWLGYRWKIARPFVANQTGRLVFANPLPPLGTVLAGNPWFLSVSTEAVLTYVPPGIEPASRNSGPAIFFQFDQIQNVEAKGKRVRVNGQLALRTGSASLASHLAETLRNVKKMAPPGRARAVRDILEKMFDTKLIAQRRDEFRRETFDLRLMTNVLFGYLFLAAPLVIWWKGLASTWPWLAGGLIVCDAILAFQFHRAHKHFYPESEDERFTNFLIVLLSPASAVRACDLIARPLLERFHPVGIARVLCSEKVFADLAQRYLRELRYPALPLCPRPEPGAPATERYARELARDVLEKFLSGNSLNPAKLIMPPEPADATSRSFCPRCQAQFTALSGTCQDCGGISLAAFKKEPN